MDRALPQAIARPVLEASANNSAELIVSYLEQLGIEYVFGVPGGAIEPLYDALARSERRGGVRAITARHEAGAAFMADGYARETGKLGVCIATSGPGATNLITGIACSYDNGVPVLAITGQPALPTFGRKAFQESGCTGVNVLGMFQHCTHYSTLVSHSGQTDAKTVNAVMRAMQSKGPVHLSIPVDVQRGKLTGTRARYDLHSLWARPCLVDEFAVERLEEELFASFCPVFLIGGGAGEAASRIVALAERLGACFVTTPDGKGFIDPHHELYRGVFGFAGNASAHDLLRTEPDLIVAAGASLGEWSSGGWSEGLLNERLIHIDDSEDNLLRSPMARLHVRGSIATVFERLLAVAPERGDIALNLTKPSSDTGVVADCSGRVAPQVLMHVLSERCPPGTRFFADTGNSTAWAVHCLKPRDRRHKLRSVSLSGRSQPGDTAQTGTRSWLRVTMDFAPMGWAIGASIGAAQADSRTPVVCITGDGSYLMNGQEITVAQEFGLPMLFVVLNDGALGMVMHGQRLANAERVGFELPAVDFAQLAASLGVRSRTVKSLAELESLDLAELFAEKGPMLLDVHIDREQVPPLGVRMKVLEAAR